MKMLKPGDPCPLCGQPIKTNKPEELELLSAFQWFMDLSDVLAEEQKESQNAATL